jgi:hypothetical protein
LIKIPIGWPKWISGFGKTPLNSHHQSHFPIGTALPKASNCRPQEMNNETQSKRECNRSSTFVGIAGVSLVIVGVVTLSVGADKSTNHLRPQSQPSLAKNLVAMGNPAGGLCNVLSDCPNFGANMHCAHPFLDHGSNRGVCKWGSADDDGSNPAPSPIRTGNCDENDPNSCPVDKICAMPPGGFNFFQCIDDPDPTPSPFNPPPNFGRSPCQSMNGQFFNDGDTKQCINPAGNRCICHDGAWDILGNIHVLGSGFEAKKEAGKRAGKGSEDSFLKPGQNATA